MAYLYQSYDRIRSNDSDIYSMEMERKETPMKDAEQEPKTDGKCPACGVTLPVYSGDVLLNPKDSQVDDEVAYRKALEEVIEAFNDLLNDAIEERRSKFGDFRGGPEVYYSDDIELLKRMQALNLTETQEEGEG